ncbi:hypothetical protein G7Z17_g1405 [Cylindrodendrum hubeiense]|uniref:Zn(2)-C6 fungal-type domain-containing protein n=1 Tax=Cylindrodendrum hubeiense TaxID=595255 RepID=A0A9P5LM37_9HYPO|nr:hypothetical protein G7Z17_g1405 [Cylindrodendrum hubeiense]
MRAAALVLTINRARRIKCDECKPHCDRCTTTGRKCDGYAPPKTDHGLATYRPRQALSGSRARGEGRALQFFREKAGPSLSAETDPQFWTQLVMQFSSFEPSVRHAVVAISALYEEFNHKTQPEVRLGDNRLALRHYNAAIRELKSMENPSIVLLVCILFTCIECLQSNKEAAIRHCKAGIAIMESATPAHPWTKEHLLPIFRRLSIVPFFFRSASADFANLIAWYDPVPTTCCSFSDAQTMMDDIFCRTVQLVRLGDAHRIGSSRYQPVPPELLAEQEKIVSLLDQWQVLFADFDTGLTSQTTTVTKNLDTGQDIINDMLRWFLVMRHQICRIWSETAFSAHETRYDAYLDSFRRLIARAKTFDTLVTDEYNTTACSPKFIFETGFMAMLFFVVTKCRCLDTRLEALRLMRILGIDQENLWGVSAIYGVVRRVIEIEHEVLLDESGQPWAPASCPGLPPDEMRVRDTLTEPNASVNTSMHGFEVRGRIVGFFMRTLDDSIYLHIEFLASKMNGVSPGMNRPRVPIRPTITI